MSIRTIIPGEWAEGATLVLGSPAPITITDVDGKTPLPNADSILTSLVMTLFELRSGTPVNATAVDRDILNANGGVVTDAGLLTIALDGAADMVCVSQSETEAHVARIVGKWGANPEKVLEHEIVFTVRRLETVAAVTP
jgi:hypothetical protein